MFQSRKTFTRMKMHSLILIKISKMANRAHTWSHRPEYGRYITLLCNSTHICHTCYPFMMPTRPYMKTTEVQLMSTGQCCQMFVDKGHTSLTRIRACTYVSRTQLWGFAPSAMCHYRHISTTASSTWVVTVREHKRLMVNQLHLSWRTTTEPRGYSVVHEPSKFDD